MYTSHISTVASPFPSFYPPLHFPIFPSTLTDTQYKYSLWLDIAYGSAKEWLTQALAECTTIHRKAEKFI